VIATELELLERDAVKRDQPLSGAIKSIGSPWFLHYLGLALPRHLSRRIQFGCG